MFLLPQPMTHDNQKNHKQISPRPTTDVPPGAVPPTDHGVDRSGPAGEVFVSKSIGRFQKEGSNKNPEELQQPGMF